MKESPFQIGDFVLLSNSNTRYGYNSIPPVYWGNKEYMVTWVDPSYGAGEVAAYHIEIAGRPHHVVHSMLSIAGGPW